ncbi:MAG: type II secretion system major pseudopilin GspG [Spirochaetales bacterium]|nr:type II secretion system major pseudopilin GspG [Spirochaetales bacterium]
MKKLAKDNGGWTFIETLIVIAIILLLSGTVGIVAIKQVAKARVANARSQIDNYVSALQQYYFDCGSFPSEEQGLEALFTKPNIDPVPDKWDGPYIAKRLADDPWGHPYVYQVPGPNGLDYAILSYGADGLQGGSGKDEDIVSW